MRKDSSLRFCLRNYRLPDISSDIILTQDLKSHVILTQRISSHILNEKELVTEILPFA
jgi:hypothetical protein